MKAFLITLLASALFFGLGHTLHCYSCEAAMNDRHCMKVENCTSDKPRCETIMADVSSIKILTKRCASSCIKGNQNLFIANITEDCCSTDLCNTFSIGDNNIDFYSGAASVKISSLVGATSAAVIGALLMLGL